MRRVVAPYKYNSRPGLPGLLLFFYCLCGLREVFSDKLLQLLERIVIPLSADALIERIAYKFAYRLADCAQLLFILVRSLALADFYQYIFESLLRVLGRRRVNYRIFEYRIALFERRVKLCRIL